MRILPANEAARVFAVEALRRGELLIFPTETVYGIGADAQNAAAAERLTVAKGRPLGKPFQWLVATPEIARRGSSFWDPRAERLARAFWPGPLTLVVPAGERSVGWRVPRHTWLLELLHAWGGALMASSANLTGLPPPKACAEAVRGLGGSVSLAVDGGILPPGEASTVVEFTPEGMRLLRSGAIPEESLRAVLDAG
ncbi:MAG: threonylcarbamoyl-AMP synthase [Verrucomicrobiae bacterium]|nr:threonylcarbamoyl-AMP synthase [Verrucomicrobiae bacterium]